MTKQEFVDQVANRSGLSKADAGKAVDAFLDSIEAVLKGGGSVNFTGFGKFSTSDSRGAHGGQPAHRREGPNRRHHGAEVLGRKQAQGDGQGGRRRRLLAPAHAESSRGSRRRPPFVLGLAFSDGV